MGNIARKFLAITGSGRERMRMEWDDPNSRISVSVEGTEVATFSGTGGFHEVGRSVRTVVPVCGNAKVGATAGWVITAGTNKYSATLPASQTGSTLVVPISGLDVGDILTGVCAVGQVESAGATVTMTMDVRKMTAAAADITDASVTTDTSGSLIADTKLDDATGVLKVTGMSETQAVDSAYYVLFTCTTAALTDIDLISIIVTKTKATS